MDGSERCSGSGWEDESMRQNIECVHSFLDNVWQALDWGVDGGTIT